MDNTQNSIEKLKQVGVKVSREIKGKTLSLIITSFGLVAGLAWNEAIQALINSLFALNRNSILAKFIYALIITSVLVLMTLYLARIFKTEDDNK